MAYQIKRSARFTDELQLVADSGEAMMVVPVDLDIDRIAQDVYKRYFDMVHAQQELQKMQPAAHPETAAAQLEKLGGTIISLFTLLFGEKNTAQILDFFDGNYTEMMAQTYPYLIEVIIPEIRKRADARKKEMLAKRRGGLWRR